MNQNMPDYCIGCFRDVDERVPCLALSDWVCRRCAEDWRKIFQENWECSFSSCSNTLLDEYYVIKRKRKIFWGTCDIFVRSKSQDDSCLEDRRTTKTLPFQNTWQKFLWLTVEGGEGYEELREFNFDMARTINAHGRSERNRALKKKIDKQTRRERQQKKKGQEVDGFSENGGNGNTEFLNISVPSEFPGRDAAPDGYLEEFFQAIDEDIMLNRKLKSFSIGQVNDESDFAVHESMAAMVAENPGAAESYEMKKNNKKKKVKNKSKGKNLPDSSQLSSPNRVFADGNSTQESKQMQDNIGSCNQDGGNGNTEFINSSVPSRYPVRLDETDNDVSDLVAYDCGAYDEQPDLAVNERIGALDAEEVYGFNFEECD